jgi:hypothetical protein
MRVTPLLAVLICAALANPQSMPPPGHETLHYNVEWRLITAGKAVVDWGPAPRSDWQVKFHLESVGLVSKLFKVEDDYSAILSQSLCTQGVEMTTHEGNRRRETRIQFEGAAHRSSYVERDLVRNSVMLSKEIEIPSCVHDVIGGLFYVRTLRLEPGQSAQVAVSDGKKSVLANVEAQQREDVRTPAGTFKTVQYEIMLFNGVLFQRSAHLHVWVTDDARRIPVQIRVRMPVTIGTITLQLEKRE